MNLKIDAGITYEFIAKAENGKLNIYKSLIENGFCGDCNRTLSNDEKEKLKNGYLEKIAKPWHDPESLFCDTKFLKKIIGKEPRKGDECKDNQR